MEPGTRKIKIKIQTEQERQADTSEKARNYLLLILFFLVPTLIFAASLALFLLSPSTHISYPFELGRFSGTAEIYSHQNRQWTTVTRQSHRQIILNPRDKIRTQSDSDLDFRIPEVLDLRLKASSELEIMKTKHEEELKFKLNKGGLLGLTGDQFGNRKLEVITPRLISTVQGTASFLIQTGKVYSSAGALVGQITAQLPKSKNLVTIHAFETFMRTDDKKMEFKTKRVNYQEWKALSEVRDLTVVSVEAMTEQFDLRKKAGNFFNYVFDDGVFFKPNWGYAEREFYEDSESKQVILRIAYDVFPQSSFSGMYFKIRGLDLSKVHQISMNVKSDPGKPVPNQFRIEFKDRLSTARGFAVKPISKDWKNYAFDFNTLNPTPVGEIVFVFENIRVGVLNTSGTVYIKDLTIT